MSDPKTPAKPEKPTDAEESPVRRRKRERLLDLELEGTFPASDPPSSTQPVHPSTDDKMNKKKQ